MKTKTQEEKKYPGKTILIVEDDRASYKLLKVLLHTLEIKTIWAEGGIEAVKICSDNPDIDLVLMDIKMPDMNGYEATKRIKKFRPELPIIAQTAYALYGDDIKAAEAGCDEYITKPVMKKELFELISKYLK
ncbi:MAG: response regulator [Bacteroidales bacterium]|nr:response regulator [Bacteroidales bacterium]